MSLKETPHELEIICDVCGRVGEGSFREILFGGWAVMRKTMEGPASFIDLVACFSCLLVRRFGKNLNLSLYSQRDEVLKKWEEIELESSR